MRWLLVIAALLVAVSGHPASADEGDAPDVEARRAPEVRARVVVLVLGERGEPLPSATRATLQVSLERALERDARLEIVDADIELARRAGQVPTDAVSEARGLLRAGEELLRRGQTRQALAKLEAASAHLAEVLAWASKQELAEAQFLLGAAYALEGSEKKALGEFVSLLAWRPKHVADTTIEPAKVMPLWEKAQKKAAKLEGGSIEIASTPDGAMAYVDGRFVGFTPTLVEGMATATHYVTVRMHGRVRSVSAVEVSGERATELKVNLEATPGVDRMREAVAGVAAGVGKAQAPAEVQAAFGDLAEMLEVEHAVVLVAPDDAMGTYQGYVYAVEGGTLLAGEKVTLGERDPEDAFGELARELYAGISFEPIVVEQPVEPAPRRRGKPFYKTWWFWTGVGAAVATGVAIPLLVGGDEGPPPIGCPPGESCGVIVFDF